MKLPLDTISNSEKETIELAKEFAPYLNHGDIVTFTGELGAGKTFFIKAVCNALEIYDAGSPSFAIINEYTGNKKLYHLDFYRIRKLEELYDIGIEEYLADMEAIKFIEWADLFHEIIPIVNFSIKLSYLNNYSRRISIEKNE